MKAGKLNSEDLKSIIDQNTTIKREEVRVRPGIGEDCSVISFGTRECVVSTDPITAAIGNIGKLAVNINCNDIASCGVAPMGLLVTILAPEGTELLEIQKVMKDIDEECKKLNVEILGGHTEITTAVNRIIVSCTAIGSGAADSAIATSGAQDGDDIIVTKCLAMEGTAIIAKDYKEKLKNIFTQKDYIEAEGFFEKISVVKEGIIAGEMRANSMHDITEGGVLGALWEVTEASNKGFIVHMDKMPIKASSKKLCKLLEIDPLRLVSSGSMLITTNKGEELLKGLRAQGIKCEIIGKITENKKILIENGKEIQVTPPERDELFKGLEYLNEL